MHDFQINKRFKKVIEELSFVRNDKIDKANFAKHIGISQGTIGNITNFNKEPGEKTLKALVEKHPEINISWILTGEGSIYGNKTADSAITSSEPVHVYKVKTERLEWKIDELTKEIAAIKEENKKLLEENAILRYRLEGGILKK